jgi:hypothetical protein
MSQKRSSPPAVVAAGASMRSYAAASIPDHSRNMLGQLFAAHTHLGRKTGDFVGLLKAAEIDVSESSLFAWRALAVRGRPVVSPVKAPGRRRVASAEELELLLGFAVNKCGGARARVGCHARRLHAGRAHARLGVDDRGRRRRHRRAAEPGCSERLPRCRRSAARG